jgi:hypothetical protein
MAMVGSRSHRHLGLVVSLSEPYAALGLIADPFLRDDIVAGVGNLALEADPLRCVPGSQCDLGPGSQVTAPDVAANAVNGTDVVNGSIAGADIAASALPKGRKITSSCNPGSTVFVDCGSLTINLPRPGLRVLIVASAMWNSDSEGATRGACRLGVNGAPFGPNVLPGQLLDNSDPTHEQNLTLTNVTDPNLGAGNHTFGLACQEIDGDIDFDETMVSAVVLGPG